MLDKQIIELAQRSHSIDDLINKAHLSGWELDYQTAKRIFCETHPDFGEEYDCR